MNAITTPIGPNSSGGQPFPIGALSDTPRWQDVDGGGAAGTTVHTLRRTGRKPVRFEGWQLVEAIGAHGNRDIWHDLNIYRTVKGGIVVELIIRRASADQQDLSRVKVFADLVAAADWLEAYRPAEDVPIPAGLGVFDTALPWAVLQAVQLRQRIDRVDTDYHALLSEVFAALDLADPADAAQTLA